MPAGRAKNDGRSREIEAVHTMGEILNCNLDRRTLAVLLDLIEAGVHPEALADIVLEARAMPLTTQDTRD